MTVARKVQVLTQSVWLIRADEAEIDRLRHRRLRGAGHLATSNHVRDASCLAELRLAASAIQGVVEPLGAARGQVGHHASRARRDGTSRPRVLASILAEMRRVQPQDLAP